MKRAYFRLRAPRTEAIRRLAAWGGLELPGRLIEHSVADPWLSAEQPSLFVAEQDGWTTFEDQYDRFSFIEAREWQGLAAFDALVYVRYDESAGEAQLVVVEQGTVLRDFNASRDDPAACSNVGRADFEEERIRSWVDLASFADEDPLSFAPAGWLWPMIPKPRPSMGTDSLEANIQRWLADGGARKWVATREARWADRDCDALVEELKSSSYWPLQPARVGEELEKASREWRRRD